MIKRLTSLLTVFVFLALTALPVCARTDSVSRVDLLLSPPVYGKLTGSVEKNTYTASVSVDGSAFSDVKIKLRGNQSLYDGYNSVTKRFPFELKSVAGITDAFPGTGPKAVLKVP